MRVVLFLLLSMSLLLTGCTASGPTFKPAENFNNPESEGLVYIYRPYSIVGSAETPSVFIDEIERGKLKNNGYLVYALNSGKRMIEIIDWGKPFTAYLDIVPGEEYYLRYCYILNMNSTGIQLAQIPKEYALNEIQHTKESK